MIERLKQLQSTGGQFANIGNLSSELITNYALRKEIETLSKAFLNREVSGCKNCYADAYMELITLSIEKAMVKQASKFELIRGKLLRDIINMDVSKNMTQANITDELSLYHLKTNPECVKFFAKLPNDWEALVEAYLIPGTEPEQPKPEDDAAQLEAEKKLVDEIVAALESGISKTKLREQYKSVEKVGEKMLTGNLVNELIKRADAIIAAKNNNYIRL
jgi:hypothetical protein